MNIAEPFDDPTMTRVRAIDLAWFLATCPEEGLIDFDEAERLMVGVVERRPALPPVGTLWASCIIARGVGGSGSSSGKVGIAQSQRRRQL